MIKTMSSAVCRQIPAGPYYIADYAAVKGRLLLHRYSWNLCGSGRMQLRGLPTPAYGSAIFNLIVNRVAIRVAQRAFARKERVRGACKGPGFVKAGPRLEVQRDGWRNI